MTFNKWLDIFLEEKGIENEVFNIQHNEYFHFVEQEVLIDFLKSLPSEMKKQIKQTFVILDFKNGDIKHYLNHLATGFVKSTF